MFCYFCVILEEENKMITLFKRLYNWCRRFRHRCGYRVHSPSDFFLITSVIYEKHAYYAYEKLAKQIDGEGDKYRKKVYKLLFRLINYYRPNSVIDIACDGGRSLSYMKAASTSLICYSFNDDIGQQVVDDLSSLLEKIGKIDCMHIGFTSYYKEIFNVAIDHVDENSIIIVGRPYSSAEKKRWWEEVKEDPRAIITFDLYDIGIILFPEKRYKHNYIVNFL